MGAYQSRFPFPHPMEIWDDDDESFDVSWDDDYDPEFMDPQSILCQQIFEFEWEAAALTIQSQPELVSKVYQNIDPPTALHATVFSNGDPPLIFIQKLLQVFPGATEIKDSDGDTPLILACKKSCSEEIFKAVFDANPNAALFKNNDHLLPIHFAWKSYSVNTLVQRYPKSIHVADGDNMSMLETYLSLCTQILSLCDKICILDEQVFISTTITVVRLRDVWDATCTMIKAAAKLRSQENGVLDFDGNNLHATLLCMAKSNTHTKSYFCRLMINFSPDLAMGCDTKGDYPLHLVCKIIQESCKFSQFLWLPVINDLVKAFPNCTTKRNKEGDIPLQLLSRHGAKYRSVKHVLNANPEGLYSSNLNEKLIPNVLEKVGKRNNIEQLSTIFDLIRGKPGLALGAAKRNLRRSLRSSRKRKRFLERKCYRAYF